jgi:acetoin utilization deacetylase AcuC-like enzyme
MLPFKLVYHPGYDLNLGDHVFPAKKFRMIHDRLIDEGFASPLNFEEPAPATDDEILLVHDAGWVSRLKDGSLSYREIARMEIPYSREMIEAVWLTTGGTILAARNALRERIGINLAGGFHHAFRAHGEGFCAIHDVAVAIRVLQKERLIERAMVVDCDVHHGNGTAAIFAEDPSVFTLSLHQLNNYPTEKPPSTVDIDLPDRIGDQEYLDLLKRALETALPAFRPDLVMYLAGADPYEHDQLGGLALTMDGLKQRDRMVFEMALANRAPVAVTLAGGYAADVEDTVEIHCNTVRAAREAFKIEDE